VESAQPDRDSAIVTGAGMTEHRKKGRSVKARVLLTIVSAILVLAKPTTAIEHSGTTPAQKEKSVVVIADDASSPFAIYLAPDAPQTVELGAKELQMHLTKATGAELPIIQQADPPAQPLISLGGNAASQAAGLSADEMPLEAYRLKAVEGNLFILGPDTPNDQVTETGGVSTGTLNGVYVFLEEMVGVRWLLPDEIGLYIPRHDTLSIPADLDRTRKPAFARRCIPMLQSTDPLVQQWMRRNRVLHYALDIDHEHAWEHVVPAGQFDENPDWFAMRNGKRMPPGGWFKLETTNPQLVRFYADQLIKRFRENPELYCLSVSPSDGRGWSQSPESEALKEELPNGEVSVTPLILKFYNDVAKLVGEAMPGKAVGGYIYSDYLYPPKDGIPPLEQNLYLAVATMSEAYGYRLYQDWARERWFNLIPVWGESSARLAYFDLPVKMIQNMGGINEPGLEILAIIFPKLAKHDYESLYFHGVGSWSHGGLTNYLIAKLMWDPYADPAALADDYCQHAYGPAAEEMKTIYAKLAERLKEHHRGPGEKIAKFKLTDEILEAVYVPLYPEFERLYLEALKATEDGQYRQRVEYFGKALKLLRWNLVHKNMLADTDSPLRRTDAQIDAMLAEPNGHLALAPDPDREQPIRMKPGAIEVEAVEPITTVDADPLPWRFKGTAAIVLLTDEQGQTTITCTELDNQGETPRFLIRDAEDHEIAQGAIRQGRVITPPLEAGKVYFLDVAAERATYQLQMQNCTPVVHGRYSNIRPTGDGSMLLFHVPESDERISLTISAQAVEEPRRFDIISPSGEIHHKLEQTKSMPSVRFAADAKDLQPGFWAAVFHDESEVKIELGSDMRPWLVLDPARPAVVRGELEEDGFQAILPD
jgi:hypothetical protein